MRDFDGNATAQVSEAAWRAYAAWAGTKKTPAAAAGQLQQARQQVASVLGAQACEVFFTSGGTHADRLALLLGCACAPPAARKQPTLVTGALEHAAVRDFAAAGAAWGLWQHRTWPAAGAGAHQGQLSWPPSAACSAAGASLLSVLMAHNETGVVQPIAALAAHARAEGAWMHTDAVQAVGRIAVHFADLAVDMLSLAGHKVGGLGGSGVLLVRAHTPLHARLQAALQGAPPPSPGPLAAHLGLAAAGVVAAEANLGGIVALVAALQALPDLAARRRTQQLRRGFEAFVSQALGPGRCKVVAEAQPRLGNTCALWLPGCEAEAVLMALDLQGFAISAGAACASGALEPSPSLLAMGFAAKAAREVVRISLPTQCAAADLEALQRALVACVERLHGP